MGAGRSKFGLIQVAVLLLVLSVLMLVGFLRGFVAAEPAGQVVRTVLSPVQKLFGGIYSAVDSRLEVYRDHERVLAENEALRQEVQSLRASLVKNEELAAENARLRELLGYSEEAPYELAAARVIARDRQRWRDCIVIDKGTADGVEKNAAVLGPHGIVGRVTSASLRSSAVMLISDPQSALSGRVQESRALVSVEGSSRPDGLLKFECLESGDKVKVGDLVITSGLGGVFPPGLVVGRVHSVEKDFYGISDTGLLTPASNLMSVESVLVVINGGNPQ